MAFKLNKSSSNLFHKIGESKSKNPDKDPMLSVGVGNTSSSALKKIGPAITPKVEKGVIPTNMTTGRSGHLDEVSVKSGPRKKTRAEHRLDKTQVKQDESRATSQGYVTTDSKKAKRLEKRKTRLKKKIARQDIKMNKKVYARKDKKFYKDREENA